MPPYPFLSFAFSLLSPSRPQLALFLVALFLSFIYPLFSGFCSSVVRSLRHCSACSPVASLLSGLSINQPLVRIAYPLCALRTRVHGGSGENKQLTQTQPGALNAIAHVCSQTTSQPRWRLLRHQQRHPLRLYSISLRFVRPGKNWKMEEAVVRRLGLWRRLYYRQCRR